ncbi:MAG: 3-oxoacyl-[acyl-carrier-protein] synthase III C-terminal domain-containing protein [Cyanobacteria bacterium P01_D01_bin.44]
MSNCHVGIRSLALSFPRQIRTNDYWRKKYPDLVGQSKPRRVRVSRPLDYTDNNSGLDIWSQAVFPYLPDPFRGAVERRVLERDESALTLEYQVAQEALEAAKLSSKEVDLAIIASLFSEQVGPGNAAYLARQLELCCPAWSLESTCSSALVALQTARALVQAGEYRKVLVIVSHIGSNSTDEEDTLSWSVGDAAGAFVVDSLQPNQGILSSKIIPTTVTCDAYAHEMVIDVQGIPRIRTRTGGNASLLAETAVDFARTCCEDAIASAGITLDQINFFAFNTPTAWYASVCAQALGIDSERTLNLYPRYANIGPVSAIASLYHAAQSGRLRANDLVLIYTNGAAATAAATVMRWGDVALGSVPALPIDVTPGHEKIHIPVKDTTGRNSITETISREQVLASEPIKRHQLLEAYLLKCLADLLQCSSATLDAQQPLAQLLDSLLAMMLKSRIEADLQVRMPIGTFFEKDTAAKLASLLLNQLTLANLVSSESVSDTDVGNTEEREKLSL